MVLSPLSPAKAPASLRRVTNFQAIRPYLGARLERSTRRPSEAVDLTQLIARGFGPALADCPLARVIGVNGVREKNGQATANQERN